jgi:Ca2+-binding RTX toxin-like protein
VENLTLTGVGTINGTGNELNNNIIGNSAANVLTGDAGNDSLNGGAGADTLIGGAGFDQYFVDNVNDVVVEAASEGTDVVYSSISYTLGANVEQLVLTGTLAINGTGNELANYLLGNNAANILIGGAGNDQLTAGLGADTLMGGTDNDTYYVDNINHVVTEAFSEGDDTIHSRISFTLSANVEHLTLSGNGIINGTGNELANKLVGNASANTLSGGAGNDTLDGGSGSDTLIGGAGDDIYMIDNINDVVTEYSGEGTDTVYSTVSYTLLESIEHLTLNGLSIINGTGNASTNKIVGSSGSNILSGLAGNDTIDAGSGNDTLHGGIGNDVLTGGTGMDVFSFNTALNSTSNLDIITDFTSSDKIQLDNDIFSAIAGTGALSINQFYTANGATSGLDADDRIVHNKTNGMLYYDADGSGSVAAVAFAQVTAGITLSNTSFVVI